MLPMILVHEWKVNPSQFLPYELKFSWTSSIPWKVGSVGQSACSMQNCSDLEPWYLRLNGLDHSNVRYILLWPLPPSFHLVKMLVFQVER